MRALLLGGLLLLPLHAGARQHVWKDSTHWVMLGHETELHVGARPRGSGAWSPQALVTHTRRGDPLRSRPESYALASREPAGSLALTFAPLRFRGNGRQVSVLDLDMGYASGTEGSGTALQVGVLKMGFSF